MSAVWPSTGNYCRGGVAISRILGCRGVAVLPEGMSRERFEWLESVAGEIIKTPGSESNVKEIFDKCWELRQSGDKLMIFNQFDDMGNYLWHYHVTGHAMAELIAGLCPTPETNFKGVVLSTGSGGTLVIHCEFLNGPLSVQRYSLHVLTADIHDGGDIGEHGMDPHAMGFYFSNDLIGKMVSGKMATITGGNNLSWLIRRQHFPCLLMGFKTTLCNLMVHQLAILS